MGEPRPLWVVLAPGRWAWVVEKNRLSKEIEEQARQQQTSMSFASVPAPRFPLRLPSMPDRDWDR